MTAPIRGKMASCLLSEGALGCYVLAFFLYSREPGHLLHPQFWAEDGVFWLAQAYNTGFACLTQPMVGYLQTLSRLGGLLAVQFPLTYAPLIFALIAFAVQLSPAMLLLSSRGEGIIPSLPVRLLVALYYIGLPNSAEVYVNLTNAMWNLAILAFLLVVTPKPRSAAGLAADLCVLLLAGLSGPLVLFIAAIAWGHTVELRRCPEGGKRVLYALLLSVCAFVQAAFAFGQFGTRQAHLGATWARLAHILANQIFLGGVIGSGNMFTVIAQSWWTETWPAMGVCAIALALIMFAFVKGPPVYRQLLTLSALLMVSALKSPMVSTDAEQWVSMQSPGGGGRYYMIPMLAWFMTFLVLASGRTPWAWLGRGLILCCVAGVLNDWQHAPYVDTNYHDAAKRFDRGPPGTVVMFQENPVMWKFSLQKH